LVIEVNNRKSNVPAISISEGVVQVVEYNGTWSLRIQTLSVP
jgi:hypothetical protein